MLVKLGIFPNFRRENTKYLSCHHLDYVQSPHFSMIHHGIYTTKALEEVPEASLAGFPDKGNNGPPRRFLGVQFRMGNQTCCKVCFFLNMHKDTHTME